MKSNIYIIAIITFLSSACSKPTSTETTTESGNIFDLVQLTPAQEELAKIKTGSIQERLVSSSIKVAGRLEAPPQNQITISAPFAGFVKSTELLPGMEIKKGSVIAEMQHPDYIQFQQDYLEAKSQLDYLDAEYKRQQGLAKENINSEKSLQLAKANYFSTLAKVQGLKAKIQLMNLDISLVEKGEFTSIMRLYSPINGFVSEVKMNVGKYVNPTDMIVRILNTDHLHAELRIFEKDITHVKAGQLIDFYLVGDTTRRKATVYLVGREIAEDRSITVHGHLLKEDHTLLPGMYLNGTIESNPVKTLMVPVDAVVAFEGKSYVFILKGSRQYQMVTVKKGLEADKWVQIELPEGTDGNSLIVFQGAYSLLSKIKNKEEG